MARPFGASDGIDIRSWVWSGRSSVTTATSKATGSQNLAAVTASTSGTALRSSRVPGCWTYKEEQHGWKRHSSARCVTEPSCPLVSNWFDRAQRGTSTPFRVRSCAPTASQAALGGGSSSKMEHYGSSRTRHPSSTSCSVPGRFRRSLPTSTTRCDRSGRFTSRSTSSLFPRHITGAQPGPISSANLLSPTKLLVAQRPSAARTKAEKRPAGRTFCVQIVARYLTVELICKVVAQRPAD